MTRYEDIIDPPQDKSSNGAIERYCEVCGKLIERPPEMDIKTYKRRRFCSRVCAYKVALPKGQADRQNLESIVRYCEVCGEPIVRSPATSLAAYLRLRFCGKKCIGNNSAGIPYERPMVEVKIEIPDYIDALFETLGMARMKSGDDYMFTMQEVVNFYRVRLQRIIDRRKSEV